MGDDQNTSGTSVNPATDSHAPRQSEPVMDVTPAPATVDTPPVVAAPPESDSPSEVPPVSEDIARQIAVDADMPAEQTPPVSSPEPQPTPVADAPKPVETTTGTLAEATEPQPKRDHPAPATVKVPKSHNPARSAIVVTVIITVVLACLAVFAYLSK